MKKFSNFLFLVFLATATSYGAGKPASTQNPPTSLVTGIVQSIDESGNRVRIRDSSGETKEYVVNTDTHFTSNDSDVKFDELHAGASVSFSSSNQNGTAIINQINISRSSNQ